MTWFLKQCPKLAELFWSLWPAILKSGKTINYTMKNAKQKLAKSTKSIQIHPNPWCFEVGRLTLLCATSACSSTAEAKQLKCCPEPKCYEVHVKHPEGTWEIMGMDLNGSQWALVVWSGWQAFLALDCASRPGQAGKGWGGSESKVLKWKSHTLDHSDHSRHLSPFAVHFCQVLLAQSFSKRLLVQNIYIDQNNLAFTMCFQCFLAFPPAVAGLGHTDSGSSASRSARLVRGRPISMCITKWRQNMSEQLTESIWKACMWCTVLQYLKSIEIWCFRT